MKDRHSSQISSSEDSDEASEAEKPPASKSSATFNNHNSDEFSCSSNNSEDISTHNSSAVEQTKTKKSPQKDIGGSPLKQLTLSNPDLTRLEARIEIDEDDDVCFLEVPKTLDVDQFVGKSINFDQKTKIKINKVKYVIEPNDESIKPITLLTKKLHIIQPVAMLHIHEYKKHKNQSLEFEPEKFKPSLPENLKVRHPLFGVEYKHKVVLSEEIEKKLDSSIDHFIKKMKKKKKNKDKKTVKVEPTENSEPIFTLLESHGSGKKKKKIKKEIATNEDEIQEECEDSRKNITNIINSTVISGLRSPSFELDISVIPPQELKKKKKVSTSIDEDAKRKQERDGNEYETEVEESPKKKKKSGNLESLDNQGNYNKKKIKEEKTSDLDLPVSAHGSPTVEKNRKKKSVKNRSLEEETDHKSSNRKKKKKEKESNCETELESSPTKSRKDSVTVTKKKIKEEDIFSLQLPSFDMEDTMKESKKKESFNESDRFNESANKKKKNKSYEESKKEEARKKRKGSHSEECSPKKKVKEETEADTLIMDLLTMVKGEIDDPKKKKKHKSDR